MSRRFNFARVSTKNQVVIPKEVREAFKIKPGDELLFEVGKYAITVVPRPVDYVESLRGLGSELWSSVEVEEYLVAERESW